MTWDDAPGGLKVLKLGQGEIRTMRTGRFLDELDELDKDMEMFMVVADLASGIQFWFSDISWKCKGGFPAWKAFAWAKTLDRLSCDMRDGLETLCLCVQCAEDFGKVKYEWEAEARRGQKDPMGSRGWSRTMDAAGNAMARKLLPFLKPEAVRRLDADLSGKQFEEKVLDMPSLDLMAESKGSYAKYKILCQLRGCNMFLDEPRFRYMFMVLNSPMPHTFRGDR